MLLQLRHLGATGTSKSVTDALMEKAVTAEENPNISCKFAELAIVSNIMVNKTKNYEEGHEHQYRDTSISVF